MDFAYYNSSPRVVNSGLGFSEIPKEADCQLFAGLDFFSVADHCSYPYDPINPFDPYGNDGLTVEEYNSLKKVAEKFNKNGKFVTFWGFEWTSDDMC